MQQEVRVQIDISLIVDAKHSRKALRGIVERGVRKAFPNNHKHIRTLRFAEEADLYSHSQITWEVIFAHSSDAPPARNADAATAKG